MIWASCLDPKLRSIFQMKIESLDIPGTFEISTSIFEDSRGNFEKIYSEETYSDAGLAFTVKQANISRNLKKATVRGIHFQSLPFMESKIVTCFSKNRCNVRIYTLNLHRTNNLFNSKIVNHDKLLFFRR